MRYWTVVFLLLLWVSPGMAALVAHWALDEASGTAVDSAGTANNMTCTACPTVVTGHIGAQARQWDGVDDALTTLDQADLTQIATLSVAWWMNVSSAGEGNQGHILNKRGSTNGWSVVLDSNAGRTQVVQFLRDYVTTDLRVASANNAWPTSTWTHVIVTDAGTGAIADVHIYINNVETGSYQNTQAGVGGAASEAGSPLYMGNNPAGAATVAGILDEVKIWNHVLSPAERATEFGSTPASVRKRRIQITRAPWLTPFIPLAWRSR